MKATSLCKLLKVIRKKLNIYGYKTEKTKKIIVIYKHKSNKELLVVNYITVTNYINMINYTNSKLTHLINY